MRIPPPLVSLWAAGCIAVGVGGSAPGPTAGLALNADPQYYVIVLPASPIRDVAEEVLGNTLGLPYRIGPTVTGQMAFQAEGTHTPQALLEAFAEQAFDAGMVVVVHPSTGLEIVRRDALAASIARGAASLVGEMPTTPAPPIARAASDPADAPMSAVPLWLASGIAFGVGGLAMLTFMRVTRRARRPAPPQPHLQLPYGTGGDADLSIPQPPREKPAHGATSETRPT